MEISLCSLCKAGTMKMLCIRENRFLPIGGKIYCSCHAIWLPCKTAIRCPLQVTKFWILSRVSAQSQSVLENLGRPPCVRSVLTTSVKINLLLTKREGRTGKYWPEVVAVRTERTVQSERGPIFPGTARGR